ncbi:MAG: hypothetical protein M3154_08085, partial [Candidatus Eremiobacteraeota bacterium]|nr:hypothetical protein [Candidatus Eremiobacteraeota bacterium]
MFGDFEEPRGVLAIRQNPAFDLHNSEAEKQAGLARPPEPLVDRRDRARIRAILIDKEKDWDCRCRSVEFARFRLQVPLSFPSENRHDGDIGAGNCSQLSYDGLAEGIFNSDD